LLIAPSLSYAHYTKYAFVHFLFFWVLCWFVKQEQKQKETRKRWRTKQKNLKRKTKIKKLEKKKLLLFFLVFLYFLNSKKCLFPHFFPIFS